MFSRPLRLSREAIARVSSDSAARRATSEHFSVVCAASDSAASGCAVVVSKKVSKTSVGRHLLKRRMQAVLKEWYHSSQALIVYARAGANTLPYSVLSDELSALLPRAGASRTI
jgi:ribonuclease P protein component